MSTPTKRLSLEDQYLLTNRIQPPILNTYQSTGKYHWIIASIASFGGTGGVGYLSIKNFVSGSGIDGGILGAGALICASACAYCMYRFVDALRTRTIEPISSTFDEEVASANTIMLRSIHTRLNTLLNQTEIIGLELRIDDVRLPDSINQQLTELEHMLPDMRQELSELKETIEAAIYNRSADSRSASAYNSPSNDASFERGILGKLTELSKKVGTDQLSRNSSRIQSTCTSPIVGGNFSNLTVTPIKRSKLPSLDLYKNINNGSDSDSDEKK